MQLLGNRIIVRKIEKKSQTGLILLDEEKNSSRLGEVMAIGNKCEDLKVGDTVIYSGGISCDDISDIVSEFGKGCVITYENKGEMHWAKKYSPR